MLNGLKADFHLHTGEDRREKISYSAKELIDRAGQQGYKVLAITNHEQVTHTRELKEYAASKDILLLPGTETIIEGKHVLIIGSDGGFHPEKIKTFKELQLARQNGVLVIAPHPFFPSFTSLNSKLSRYLEAFDAIEYSHFYLSRINFNLPAERLARKHGIPLVGTSDAHSWRQFGTTYSRVKAKQDPEDIIRAVKKGDIELVTHPLGAILAAQCYLGIWWNNLSGLHRSRNSK
jgi:predicted metal-dependent phosphoesterase TrpH